MSWSSTTPFRLVTIAGDSLARMWDVREAALKRCKNTRQRSDYILPLNDDQSGSNDNGVAKHGGDTNDDIALPPLPVSLENNEGQESSPNQQARHNVGVYVPPLPAGAENGIGAEVVGADGNPIVSEPGAFVANSEIDEGVLLLSRFQHGDLVEDTQFRGAGTRSRRKKVKVVCLSRCPIGGHFATGSDDGIGRIWLDDDNEAIDKLDEQNRIDPDSHDGSTNRCQSQFRDSLQRTRASSRGNSNGKKLVLSSFHFISLDWILKLLPTDTAPSTSSLLASLHGHHNEITDIKYSNRGDRLLTASQKDGVVRVWSWGTETSRGLDGSMKIDQFRQIFIRMEPPHQCQHQGLNAQSDRSGSGPASRRRGGNPSSQKSSIHTQCDVAAWTADDTKIITSQSCVAKPTDTDIIPGSHIIYVWDSRSGECLVGLPGAHDKPCPVLFSHPLDSSIIVSAGADGCAKVWDLDAGKCIFSHRNVHKYGSLENLADRGKLCGYLDGGLSPDGMHLVLTDDSGRITIIDVLSSEEEAMHRSNTETTANGTISAPVVLDDTISPTWMQEQYFANDYYDLYYDSSGYCIERGSRLPPHLAPVAAMCLHDGHPYADSMQLAFTGIEGPLPLLEDEVCTGRDSIRNQSVLVRKQGGILAQNVHGKRNLIEARATTASHVGVQTTLQPQESSARGHNQTAAVSNGARRATGATRRNMSTNYRWIGFEEMERDDDNGDGDADSDDEEYEEGNRLRATDDGDDDDDGDDEPEEEDARPSRGRQRNVNSTLRTRRRQNRNRARTEEEDFEEVISNEPTRASARQFSRRTEHQYVYESDESAFEEMLSANTNPVGEHARDYTELGHLFKLPLGASINRKWATREECVLGYTGWKTYCPQVGDKIVYIAKPHSDTLKAFPVCETATGAPWKSWPKSSAWPFVECEIKNVRYRFPYNGYYGNRSR